MRSTSLGRKGPSGASRLRFLGFLVATPSGRYLTVSVLLLLASLLIWRQALISWLGLGIVPVGTWFAVFLYLAVSSPGRIIRAWQIMAGAFAGAIAATGLLGMFNHPFETVLGQVTTGGHLGRLLARAPFEWPDDGPGIAHLLLASLRVAGVAAIAGAVLWPFQAFRVANMVAQLAAATSVFVAHAFQAARVRLAERTERRHRAREDARLAALAAVETEASLMENPCITVTQPRTRKLADESMTEEQECNAPAPSDAAAATRAPEIAGTVAVTPSPGLPGHERMGAISKPAAVPPRPLIPNYNWKLPGLDLLKLGRPPQIPQAEIEATSDLIVETLAEHGVDVKITQITAGPVVTMYGIAPGWERSRYKPGRNDSKWEDEEANRKRVRVDTILAREKDLALALASPNIRFESPIPGESLVGIEVP
ncbi:MAG: hypothetical protein HY678_08045, partial [Chloroflexi bacterium]|nr:hypothetical protein [Chloroflexota bacterium]